MRWMWWGVGAILLAQMPERHCSTRITGEKAAQHRIMVTGKTFSPVVIADSSLVIDLEIPTCADTIELRVWLGQKLLLDTAIVLYGGQRDSLFLGEMGLVIRSDFLGEVGRGVWRPVVIVGKAGHTQELRASELAVRAEGLLAQQLQQVPGVYLFGAGPLVQKPLLEGLGGTRITYLQEGVPLASQQWGEEHAPEVDPHSAEKLYVELGSRPVLFGTEAVGGVIGTETPLAYEKPLAGRLSLTGLTNGRGAILSTTFGGQYRTYQYRFHTTLSRLGTLQAPHYFLSGTASSQANFSLHLHKAWQKLSLFAHYSQYNAHFGIFQGSHVGNLSDLQRALNAPTPLITSTFTYQIQPPYQSATHELTLLRVRYFVSDQILWTGTYARQYNRRSEWDAVGLYAQAGRPAMDLQLTRHSLLQELLLIPYGFRLGLNFHYERNYTQYAYFIPRYEKYQPALYALWVRGRWEVGVRVEPLCWVAYQVPAREGRILTGSYFSRIGQWWPAWGAELQRQWQIISSSEAETLRSAHVFTFRLAYLQRPPNPAELYAYGYHQGRAAFEIGQPTFRTEDIAHLHIDWLHHQTYLCVSAYASPTFIYARVDSPVVWIRGAALTYAYQQGPAVLWSLTGRQERELSRFLSFTVQGGALWAAYFRAGGWRPLPLLPAPYLEPLATITYKGWRIKTAFRLVARQRRYDPEADLAPPPPGYGLLSGEIHYTLPAARSQWSLSLSGDNLLNQPYRPYPDLMRYFANQMGRQVRLGIRAEF